MSASGHAPGENDPHAAGGGGTLGGGLVEFSTRRRVTIAMFWITMFLFGVIALGSLKVNLLPDLSYPTLTVRTEYTGAAPSEIETLISEPVEEAVGVVKGLRKLKSVSSTTSLCPVRETDFNLRTPFTTPTASSTGSVISVSISAGAAPVYSVRTVSVG